MRPIGWNEAEARAIARALRSVAWDLDALTDVLDRHSGGLTPGWRGLVERALLNFGASGPPPRYEALWRWVARDPLFDEDYRDEMARLTRKRSWRKPPRLHRRWFAEPRFQPGPAAQWRIPRIETVGELAERLGMPESSLEGWADVGGWLGRVPPDRRQHYHRRWISGRSGPRLIEAPKAQLKKLQRWILREILGSIPAHPRAHGFVKRRSIRTHAALHTQRQLVLRFDLRHFFPSIQGVRARGLFRYAGYPDDVADLLMGLCTTITPYACLPSGRRTTGYAMYRERHLPQGAPTSPALANLVCYRLDARLSGLAERFGAQYSRYADDLTFSGDAPLARGRRRLSALLERIVDEEGFTLRPDKTRTMPRSVRQAVTGLVVNDRVSIPRAEFDRLKAILHQCALDGPEAHNRERHVDLRAHLLGRVTFVEMVDAARGAKLRARFDRIEWPSGTRSR